MTEAMGGLIQMTAHMCVTAKAQSMITWGCVLAAVCALLALCAALSKKQDLKLRYVALFLAIATISINIIGDTLRDVLDPKSSREK